MADPTITVEESERIRKFTGNYYIALGWIGIVYAVISLISFFWTDQLHLDFSPLLLLWLGHSLRKGSPTARGWALFIFYLMVIVALVAIFSPIGTATFAGTEFHKGDLAFYPIIFLMVLVISIPSRLLIGKRGGAAFVDVIPEL